MMPRRRDPRCGPTGFCFGGGQEELLQRGQVLETLRVFLDL